MKKIILALIFSFNLNLFSQSNKESKENRKIISEIVDELYSKLSGKCTRLVIFDPEYSDGRISEAGKILNERFITYFAKKGNISIIERSKLDKIYEEQKIQKSGLIDDKTSIEIGKILGADCIFTASLNDLKENRVEINSRIIKMETGEILATSISELEKEWTDRKIVEGEKVVQKITFEPTPLKKVELEEAKQIKTIDFTDTDIEVLKEYDKLYQMDLDDNIPPLDKSRLWYEFGNKYSKYSDIAKERGDYWIEYDKNLKEYKKYQKEKEEALNKDWAKLKELLALKSVDVKQKTDWIFKFLDVYGWNDKENKFYKEAKKYLPYPCVNGKIGFCYYDDSVMVEGIYDDVRSFSEGLAHVQLNDKWGFIDKTGKEIILFKYDDAEDFSEGLAPVELNFKWGFIDKTGKEVIPLKYDNAYSFSEDLDLVKLNGKWGFIDKTGKIVIPFKYDDAGNFSEGLAPVKLNGKWGYIDKTGKIVIPLKYNYADSFFEGLARVKLNGKYGFIDKFGKEYFPKYNE